MSKRLLFFLLLASLLLGTLIACQPKTQVAQATLPPTTTPVSEATSTPSPNKLGTPTAAAPTPTHTPRLVATTPAATPTRTSSPATVAPTATPRGTSSSRPEPVSEATPTRPWQVPEVQEDDWAKGNPDAGLVLVAYSDFQ